MGIVFFWVAAAIVQPAPAAWAGTERSACERLAGLPVPGGTIDRAEYKPRGALREVGGEKLPADLPAFCRVQLRVHPSPKSDIRLEVWLPTNWNGRYLQAGNGGFAGSIRYDALAAGLRNGFATANSDGGHESVGADLRPLAEEPEKIADFGYRAIGATSAAAKSAVKLYYGRAAKRAYFAGCSDGGREAWVAAQRWAAQFDGFLIGAPENDFNREMATELFLSATYRASGETFTKAQLAAISANGIRGCDGADGLIDGLIADPRHCHVDWTPITCPKRSNTSCITPAQVALLERLYRGWTSADGKTFVPGIAASIGTESAPGQWDAWMAGGAHEDYTREYFQRLVYRDRSRAITAMNVGDAYKRAEILFGAITDANDPDLSAQRRAGKKIIQYHGWGDIGIPPWYSIDFFERIHALMGDDVSDFYRLFMAPGMGHCEGGPGPNFFGGAGDEVTAFVPSHNLLAALVDWVEAGNAPDRVIATKYRDDDPAKPVLRTRPLCSYPAKAVYDGHGSIDDAANFQCR